MSTFDKWKKKVSPAEEAAVKKAMQEQRENRKQFREVPSGIYSVVADKMEVSSTTWGDPQISISFKITEGEYKNSRIFYNGSFDDHFAHGINATAELLNEMLDDDELTAAMIAVILDHGEAEADEFLADAAEVVEDFGYDLDYSVQESSKVSPKTGKPYVNKYYTITGVYDLN